MTASKHLVRFCPTASTVWMYFCGFCLICLTICSVVEAEEGSDERESNIFYDVVHLMTLKLNSFPFFLASLEPIPLMTSCEWGPLLLCGHWFLHSVVVTTAPGVTVIVTMAATLRQRELSVSLLPGLLAQFVPVLLDVRLLLQPTMVCLQTMNSSTIFT